MAEILVTDKGNIIEIIQGGDLTIVMPVENGVEIEQLRFIQLADTPKSYEDAAGKTLRVNDDGDGIIFGKTYDSFISLNDTPRNYENAGGQLVAVNAAGTGLRFINYTPDDVNIEYFTQLADVPNTYKDKAGFLVAVDGDESGLNFITKDTIVPVQSNVNPGSYKYPLIVVNNKGIITDIQEGKPFEFDPFTADELLIGDGTTTPASLEKGKAFQFLMTSEGDKKNPVWMYVDKFIDQTGKTLVIAKNISPDDNGVLTITNSQDTFNFSGDTNQKFILNSTAGTVIKGNLDLENSTPIINASSITGNLIQITTTEGLRVNPGTGTVGVSNVAATDYNTRITDNDFITKSWYENNKPVIEKSLKYIRTEVQEITNSIVTFNIPKGSTVMEVNFQTMSEFNKESKVRVIDSFNQVLFNPENCPYLDYNLFKIFLNQEVMEDNYNIKVSVDDYTYGQGSVFICYFVEG